MPAKFIPHAQKGPGNGIIVVKPSTCQNDPSFALYRSSDKLCLSPEGWQGAEVFLVPTTWEYHNDTLLLEVDESVVNYLDNLSIYKIVIKGGGVSEAFTMSIDDIVQTSMAGGQGIGMSGPEADTSEPDPNAHPARPVQPEQAEPEEALTQMPTPVQSMDKISMPKSTTRAEKISVRKRILLAIVVLVLLLIGGAFLWFMLHGKNISTTDTGASQNSTTQPAKEPTETSKDADKAKEANKTEEPAKAEESSKEPSAKPKSSAMDSARALLRTNDTGAASLALAQSLKSQAESDPVTQDAVFLLTEDAAQKGEIAAMRELGSFYDPNISQGKGSITADMREAHAWYSKAVAAGDASAQTLLNNLRIWVQKAATNGNADAQDLLKNW